jgi:hypothetical protein
VVWQGSAGNRCPYADQRPLCSPILAAKAVVFVLIANPIPLVGEVVAHFPQDQLLALIRNIPIRNAPGEIADNRTPSYLRFAKKSCPDAVVERQLGSAEDMIWHSTGIFRNQR